MSHAPSLPTGLPDDRISDIEQVCCCDFCQGESFEPELTWGRWSLVRCSRCGLVFTSPRYGPSHLRDLYRSRYYQRDVSCLTGQSVEPSEDEVHYARTLLATCGPKGGKQRPHYLEVGCGAGRMVSAFQSAGWMAEGLDLSTLAIREGRQRGINLHVGQLAHISPQSKHLIAAFHLLEHLPSPRLFLRQCVRALVPRGWLLLEVPDYGSRRARAMQADWPCLFADTHLYQFTENSLGKYLAGNGFQVVQTRRVGGRGPLEHPWVNTGFGGATEDLRSHLDIRQRVFDMRRVVWWSATARRTARFFVWHLLGFGEFLRLLARRSD